MKKYNYLLIIKDELFIDCYYFDDYDKMFLFLDTFKNIEFQTYFLDLDIEGRK